MIKLLEVISLAKKTAASFLNGKSTNDLEDSVLFKEDDKVYIEHNIRHELHNPERKDFIKNIDAQNDYKLIESRLADSPQPHSLRRYNYIWYAAAAVVLILITVSVVFFNNEKPVYEINQIVEIPEAVKIIKPLYKNDVKPGGNKAILTLSNGAEIVLDDASKGTLASQGNTAVLMLEGNRLVYNPLDTTESNTKTAIYNTLSTPRGGQYSVTLPDGTNVWLNSSTTLKFPIAFAGNERRVEVTGEAYFEVSKDTTLPFLVKAGNQEIKVLGTHFNISAYSGDKVIKTTLLEGSVQVLITGSTEPEFLSIPITLQPGQQSQFCENRELSIVTADLEEAIAWKNGLFIFNDENIESIMLKIARWYDINVVYNIDPEDMVFTGKISRSQNVSEILALLELTGSIHFKIEEKTITVLP